MRTLIRILFSFTLVWIGMNKAYCSLARQIASYQTEISTLQSSLTAKEAENSVLKATILSLEKEMGESQHQKQQLQDNLATLQTKQEQLLLTLASLHGKGGISSYSSNSSSLAAKPVDLEKDHTAKADLEREHHLMKELNEVKASLSRFKDAFTTEAKKEAALRQEYKELKQQRDSLALQVEGLRTEKEALSQKLAEQEFLLKQQDEQRQSESQAFHVREQELKAELQSLAFAHEQQEQIIQEKSHYQERLSCQIRAVAETVGVDGSQTPTKVIPKLKAALRDAQVRALEFESQVGELQSQIASLTQQRPQQRNTSPNSSVIQEHFVEDTVNALVPTQTYPTKEELSFKQEAPSSDKRQGLQVEDTIKMPDARIKAIAATNKDSFIKGAMYLPSLNEQDRTEAETQERNLVGGMGDRSPLKPHQLDPNFYIEDTAQIPNLRVHGHLSNADIEEKCCVLF